MTTRQPAPISTNPDFLPDRLRVQIGGFCGPDSLTEYKGKAIVLQRRGSFDEADDGLWITAPTQARWEAFWHDMDALKAWKWKRRGYSDPDVLDGIQWETDVEHAGRRIKSSGSNAYPVEWDGFLMALVAGGEFP